MNAMTVFGHGCPSNAFGDVKRVLVAVEDDELRGGYDSHFVECSLSSGGQWETLSFSSPSLKFLAKTKLRHIPKPIIIDPPVDLSP